MRNEIYELNQRVEDLAIVTLFVVKETLLDDFVENPELLHKAAEKKLSDDNKLK